MTDFRDRAEALAPLGGWLSDPASKAWLRAQGGAVSDTLALWKAGVKQRYASTCGEDNLPNVGDSRQLEQAPGETAAAYRLRLVRAFEIHTDRTTPRAYKHVLEPLGVDPADVYVWAHYEAGIGLWHSQTRVVVDSRSGPFTTAPIADDDILCDSGVLCDITGLVADMVAYIRRNVRKTKWAGAYPVGIWIVLSGDAWADMGLTADSGVLCDSGPFERAIMPLGRVWDQEEMLWGEPPIKCDMGVTTDWSFYEGSE